MRYTYNICYSFSLGFTMADQTKHVPGPSSPKTMSSNSVMTQQQDLLKTLSAQPTPKLSKDQTAKNPQQTLSTQSGSHLSKSQGVKDARHKSSLDSKIEKFHHQLIGQLGLKDATEVAAFLKSPIGLKTKALLQEQQILLAELKKTRQHAMLEALLKKMRIRAFLHLIAVYKRKARAKELNAAIQKQIDERLASSQKQTPVETVQPFNPIDTQAVIKQTYAAYKLAAQVIENTLEEKIKEAQELEEELAALEIEGKKIAKRYNAFEEKLSELDNQYEQFVERNKEKTTAEKIADIKSMIATLNNTIDIKRIEIDRLVVANQDEEAMEILPELNSLNGQSAGMEDILSVLEERKLFYNAAGERVDSYKEADFILPKTQRLFVDKQTGITYILTASADLNSEELTNLFNTLSPKDKLAAQRQYERTKPEISNLKALVANNKQLELALHTEKVNKALAHSELLQQEILDLTNQAAAIASMMDQIATALNQVNQQLGSDIQLATPKPKPTPGGTASAKKEAISGTLVCKHMLQLIKSNPTPAAIDRFANSFVLPDGSPNKQAQDLIRNNIKPGMPILQTTMNRLLQDLPRFGVTANSPRVTPIPDKTPGKITAPTPFKTTPW